MPNENLMKIDVETFKSSPKVIGLNQTMKKMRKDEIRFVVLAEDCDAHIAETVKEACKTHQVHCVVAGTKAEIGKACEIDRPAAVIGFLDE